MITVADERVGDWRERYGEEFAGVAERREQAMARWAELGDEALLKRHDQLGWRLTDAGGAYADLFWETTSEEWGAEVLEAAKDAGESGSCYPSARKGAPAAAFCQALGMADVARLPGCLGEFLLTAEEASALLPEIEELLVGPRHAELVEQIGRWLECAADGSLSSGAEVVDGVLRVFRRAVEHRLGVAAVSVFF